MKRYSLQVAALVFVLAGSGASGATWDPAEAFEKLAADYLEAYCAAHPVRATHLGVHAHDDRLPDLSRPAIRRRTTELGRWLVRLEGIERSSLEGDAFFDHLILERAIRAELLELEEIREWQRNPMLYNRLMADGVAGLIDRQFADVETRARALMARLGQYRRLIGTAKKNLRDVPKEWTELAVRNTRGHVRFLRDSVPVALREQGLGELDTEFLARFELSHRRAVNRLERFVGWLQKDLLPRSTGDYRLGRELFERKMLYEEHIDLTVDELNRMNREAITRYQEWLRREAARIDAAAEVSQIVRQVANDYPTPEELIPTASRFVEQARELIVERGILTLPTDGLPIIRPTPEYARTGFASMSTPGPFETVATEAYYNITNVDPGWSAEQQDQHLTYFNYGGLMGISVHEAMPGHFIQFLYKRELPTDLRKVFTPASLSEGWAHYTEQMMVDEGLGNGDPAVRLGQLRRALQRHARWHAGIALHTTEATIEETAKRFAEIAHFAPFPAYRETLRGTYNPTYLYYALGRMQILDLREDYEKYLASRGEEFSLRDFHDRFLRLGLPLPLARQALMPERRRSSPQ